MKYNIIGIADDLKLQIINWKNLTLDIVKKLHGAKEHYSNQGFRSDLTSGQNDDKLNTWIEFLNYIKLSEPTARRYLDRYIPEENKLLTILEYKEKKQIDHKNKCEKINKKYNSYEDDKDWQKIKENELNNKKVNNDTDNVIDNNNRLIKELERQELERQKFRNKITEANKYQDTFFGMIDDYIKELKSDNERCEALQNIIKYCKRIVIKFNQKT